MDRNIESELVYAAVSANRHENNISVSNDRLLYSRATSPVIYDLKSKQVVAFLIGHTDEVNGQRFIVDPKSKQNEYIYVLSTAYDKTAIIWQFHTKSSGYKLLHTLRSPDDTVFVTRCSLLKSEEQKFVSILTSLGGVVYLWNDGELVQSIKTKYCCFDSKLYTISTKVSEFTLLFLAGDDNKVHVFQLIANMTLLEPLIELTGHDDWIKCLDVLELTGRPLEFLVASASQDSYIRVWHMKLVDHELNLSQRVRTSVSKRLTATIDEPSNINSFKLTATLETVLSGHEGIVFGLCWFRKQADASRLQLLSCSADKTIVVWRSSMTMPISGEDTEEQNQANCYDQCPASAEVWKEVQRVGETGETNLPFLGVCLSDDESTFYSHSLRGAIHAWRLDQGKNEEQSCWEPERTIMGHFEPVTDLAWERKTGAYLLSCSLDKTCRLHAPSTLIGSNLAQRWHEIARPQVHGHEINCLASLDFVKFATGAEEKTIRTFEATQFFIENFKALSETDKIPSSVAESIGSFPIHAQLPALGLSIRGSQSPFDIEGDPQAGAGDRTQQQQSASTQWYGVSKLIEKLAKSDHLSEPPIEEILLQSTLWWETNKLFGHSNELHALAVDSQGAYLASASKANRPDLANIFVWECSNFRKVATLEHHSLTVTRLKFSPNSRYLLSVSRDRTWCLSERTSQVRPAYRKFAGTVKSNAKHDRIIWDCSWTYDSSYFITVSRDRKAILWSMDRLREEVERSEGSADERQLECFASMLFDCSIQAVDSPTSAFNAIDDGYLFALGFEDGSLELASVCCAFNGKVESEQPQWQRLRCLKHFHQLPIRRLAFRPTNESSEAEEEDKSSEGVLLLASGGDDGVVKLTKLFFPHF